MSAHPDPATVRRLVRAGGRRHRPRRRRVLRPCSDLARILVGVAASFGLAEWGAAG